MTGVCYAQINYISTQALFTVSSKVQTMWEGETSNSHPEPLLLTDILALRTLTKGTENACLACIKSCIQSPGLSKKL